jgi:hypothetical protein
MFRQTLFFPLMVAAVGGPFLMFSGDNERSTDNGDELSEINGDAIAPSLQPEKIYTPSGTLSDIFSFQVTPAWIKGNWDNVTESELGGYKIFRASILTGHQDQDVVGAITYRFDFREKAKSLQFGGFVTDPSAMIGLLNDQFGFRAKPEVGEYLTGGFSGFNGKVSILASPRYKGQFQIDLVISQ